MKLSEGKKIQDPKTTKKEKGKIMKDIFDRLRSGKKTPEEIKKELSRIEKETKKKAKKE